ncbi:signal peptide peptidase SppA [Massilia sp. TS11]|uniref:signal peptide peptidase SppA n=1 Tax=Massilia sp. TS11 TaxID=2908003 RepID=UPI001EDAF458|nr:signal peptide peptidase SppA [Massilia sp. TS11]MCG2583270.1 signal peptide peptidase SppA [Massilia sp. TS11]
MSLKPLSLIGRVWRGFWSAVDSTRRATMNLLFLILVVAIGWGMFAGGVKPLQDKTTLVLRLSGVVVEQHTLNVRESLLSSVNGDGRKSIQLRDVLTVLDKAAADPSIGIIFLQLDELDGASMPQLREMGLALERAKQAGKKVLAWGGNFDQRQYLLAAHASEVYLHPMGAVVIEGLGRHRNYYRDALEKLGVTVNVMKVGTYKSFAEPYIGNGPSPAAAEADAFLYNGLWSTYTSEAEKARKLTPGAVMAYIDGMPALMEEFKGDAAKAALKAKLIDGLKTPDEMREYVMKLGARDAEGKSYRKIAFDEYLMRQRPKLFGDAVAVIVAQGNIVDGVSGPGNTGGISTASLIRRAREDSQVKAVVLRIDSPGGSAFASELIRRELEITRAAGKPVVVSMGGVAASGGYWISMAADEVIADPATITGSIGVFAILPTLEKTIDKLGVHTAGVTTTWLADAYNPLRPLDPKVASLIQSSVGHIYDEFTRRAAQARKTTQDKIDAVGQGRVWTGAQAKERGLIDRLGSYQDAIKAAAQRAKLPEGYRVSYVERETSRLERVLEMLGVSQTLALKIETTLGLGPVQLPLPGAASEAVGRDLRWLADVTEHRKPFAVSAHCLCEQP